MYVLLLAIACAAVGDEMPNWSATAVAPYDALFSRTDGWTGADAAATVRLANGLTLWLFSDTWVGPVRDGRHEGATMVNNSVAIQHGNNPATTRIAFFYGKQSDGKPAALFAPADGRGFFWLFSGVRTGQGLFLFAEQVERTGTAADAFGFKSVASWLLEVHNPDESPPAWRVTQHKMPWGGSSSARKLQFGCGVLRYGGFVYVYGCDEDVRSGSRVKHLVVARVEEAALPQLDRWRFFDGHGWQADVQRLARIFAPSANECSVSYQPGLRRFVAVYTPGGLSAEICLRTAVSPEGPWSAPAVVYHCPEAKSQRHVFCYAAKAHPELVDSPDELLITYVANSFDFWYMAAHAELYRPRFVRVRWASAPR